MALQDIEKQLESIKYRIATEGITDKAGNVLMSPAIAADRLNQALTAANLPTYNPPVINSTGILASNQSLTSAPVQNDAMPSWLKAYLDAMEAPPSSADAYKKALEQSGIETQRKQVSDLSSQLTDISTQAQQAQLQLEQQSAGKDVTTQFLGRQQQEITRQAAIKSLPIQAQLSAAQGNLSMAEDKLNTYYKILSQDAQSQYQYKQKLIDSVYDFATRQEQNRLEDKRTQLNREWEAQKINNSDAKQFALEAIKNGQMELAGQIMNIDWSDVGAPKKLSGLISQIRVAPTGIKAPTVKNINGVDMQWNSITGKWETIGDGKKTNSIMEMARTQTIISDISNLLKGDIGMATAVGTSALTRSTGVWGNLGKIVLGLITGAGAGAVAGAPFAGVGAIPGAIGGGIIGAGTALFGTGKQTYSQLTGKEQNFISTVDQLKSDLSLDSLIEAKAKGATFGALSDTEMAILSSAATKIGTWEIKKDGKVVGYNASEKDFKNELNKINNFAKLDYLLKGGNPSDIGVQLMDDGHYYTQNWDGSFTKLQ